MFRDVSGRICQRSGIWDVAPGVRNRSLQGVESHDQVIAGKYLESVTVNAIHHRQPTAARESSPLCRVVEISCTTWA